MDTQGYSGSHVDTQGYSGSHVDTQGYSESHVVGHMRSMMCNSELPNCNVSKQISLQQCFSVNLTINVALKHKRPQLFLDTLIMYEAWNSSFQ